MHPRQSVFVIIYGLIRDFNLDKAARPTSQNRQPYSLVILQIFGREEPGYTYLS
jgi:hypothetical protein